MLKFLPSKSVTATIVLVVGIIMTIMVGYLDSAITAADAKCTTTTVQNSSRGILVISLLMACSALMFLLMSRGCTCEAGKTYAMSFAAVGLLVGIVLLVLTLVIRSSVKESPECSPIAQNLTIFYPISIIAIVLTGLFIAFEVKNRMPTAKSFRDFL